MKHHLCHGENIEDLVGAHEVMGVGGRETWDPVSLIGVEKREPLLQQRITFDASAVILHGFGDGLVQLLPVDALILRDGERSEEAFCLGLAELSQD